jgi:GNAT superfamily N-acetyltransferase
MPGDRIATRTYLEMKTPAALRPARVRETNLTVRRVEQCEPALWRRLYTEVGRDHRWVDRLAWTDADAAAYLNDPNVTLWLFLVDEKLAGYFELRRDRDAAVEIVYFGLLPEYTGRGLGGHLLTEAVERAWAAGATRVWLHTCSFDHLAAIPNYLSRGFTIVKTEEYLVDAHLP